MPVELHEKYAPILHFARGERFYPMAAEDLLAYAALYRRGQDQPLAAAGRVHPDHLDQLAADDTFLRTVDAAPLTGMDVARTWSRDVLELVLAWARGSSAPAYDEGRAQRLYRWFSRTTRLATRLFWWNQLFMSPAISLRRRGATVDLPRFRLPQEARDQALERYEGSQRRGSGHTYYYRMARQGDYLNLQYWFLYAHKDWATDFHGLNDHEGDWEGVQLFFRLEGGRPVEPPAYICYQGHSSRITKPWRHSDVMLSGDHPNVYVAAGSHASYPEQKTYDLVRLYNLLDRATGDGVTIKPNAWRQRINLDAAPWVAAYQGAWGTRYWLAEGALRELAGAVGALAEAVLPGEIDLPGVSAPHGPRYSGIAAERLTWTNALAFAGLASDDEGANARP